MKIGVLALQGGVAEHLDMVANIGAEGVPVKTPGDLEAIDRLIIPGGESTTIGKLMDMSGLSLEIARRAKGGMPLFGTCAGLILLSRDIRGGTPGQKTLSLMDIEAVRNAFGRQAESFGTELSIPVLGDKPFRGVFIRAPYIGNVKNGVKVLALHKNKIVAARQDNLLVSAFHPELIGDTRFHRYFAEM